jgi:FAD:protein FMN transferase
MKKITFVVLAILISSFVMIQTARANRQFTAQASLTDGTPIEITIVGSASEEGRAKSAMSSAIARATQLDSMLFAPGGIQDQINKLGKREPLQLSPNVFKLVKKATDASAQTKGFFDITAPSPKNTFTNRDWKRIVLNNGSKTISFKSEGMKIDLRKIAKGYYADLIIESLSSSGFANAKVRVSQIQRNIGRDIFTPWNIMIGFGDGYGKKHAHRAYRYNLGNAAAATVTPHGLGRGVIDGKSKQPVANNGMKSITIFANDATTATAYAIAVYAIGPKYGLKFVQNRPEIRFIMVNQDGNLMASEDLGTSNAKVSYKWPAKGSADGGPNDLRQKRNEEERDL